MPKIDTLNLKKETKKFKKVAYRPWEMEEDLEKGIPPSPPVLVENFSPSDKLHTQNKVPLDNNSDAKKALRFIHGLQKDILVFLCQNVETIEKEEVYTSPLSIQSISEFINTSRASISCSLTRLKSKGLLSPYESKTGRGGFASYKISKNIYTLIMAEDSNLKAS